MLQQLQQVNEWDIVVIGGGATGLGAALDAASRGYRTLLVEKYDFGKGTSGRSTKLIHGGVRYLAQGNIKLVMEALHERGYLLKNAPHLTTASPFVVPVYSLKDKWFYGIGLKIYDLLSGKLSLGSTKLLDRKETIKHLPGISPEGLTGGILYYDGQFDDTRLATEIAVTAAHYGATVLNYCSVEQLTKKGQKISGLIINDNLQGDRYEIRAKVVINATGVFAATIMEMDEADAELLVMPSQGIHLVVDRSFFPGTTAMMIPKTDDGRVLFAVPWHGKVLLGTTDTPVDRISIEPVALEEEIAFVIEHANRYIAKKMERKDVSSVFAGLRPLVYKKGAKSTALLSRDHTIVVSKSNLVTITGGKWTTYRKMAQAAVDNVVFVAKLPKKKCITRELRIGTDQAGTVVQAGKAFLETGFTCTADEIIQFIDNEMAMTVEDILARRTRLLFLDAKAAMAAAPEVAAVMAQHLQKDKQWEQEQVEAFRSVAQQYLLAM